MRYTEPEQLPKGTPAWFETWYNQSFWHFQYRVESRLIWHSRLLYMVLGTVFVAAISNIIF